MEFKKTKLAGCLIFTPSIFSDERGYFAETFRKSWLTEYDYFDSEFIQDNQSHSIYGTIRGLHLQTGEHAQTKLVSVLSGKILDVAVDLRKDSPTFGEHLSVELSAENNQQLWIPKGFAHGFSVLSDEAVVCYKCDAYYNKLAESGIHPLDPTLAIDWQLPIEAHRISEKDLVLGNFNKN
jgi:dTDP-4-dehydrorhamnose 3,5-epimerase